MMRVLALCVLLGGCATPRNSRCDFDWETGVINCHPVAPPEEGSV